MPTDLKMQLMEKYLHSQGAALYREGLVDEGIAFFEQAIALKDRSYTRCDLAMASMNKNDFVRALQHIDRAIALNPRIARYHYERSCLQRMKGNELEAYRDLQRAIDLDENYARIEEILEALKALEGAASPETITDLLGEKRINNLAVRQAVARIENGLGSANESLEAVSCTLPCPAFCCYFEGSPLLHGLSIGAWKLQKVREFLRQKGFSEDRFLERIDLTEEKEIQRLIPPHHLLRERGRSYVYSPKKGRFRLDRGMLASLPKGREYQDLVWIHADSWKCSFLKNRRCMVHDVGDEPALPACKEFLCLTGFVFALLTRWGLIEEEAVGGKTMEQLNRLAIEAALVLSAELCRAEDLSRIKTSLENTVSEAVNADEEGNAQQVERAIVRMEDLSHSFTKALTARKTTVRRKIAKMLNG